MPIFSSAANVVTAQSCSKKPRRAKYFLMEWIYICAPDRRAADITNAVPKRSSGGCERDSVAQARRTWNQEHSVSATNPNYRPGTSRPAGLQRETAIITLHFNIIVRPQEFNLLDAKYRGHMDLKHREPKNISSQNREKHPAVKNRKDRETLDENLF